MTHRCFGLTLLAFMGVLAGAAPCGGQVMNHYPQWSPDGAWILFGSNRTGEDELYVMSPDGTDLRRITHNDVPDVNVGWTDDGRVLFQSLVDGDWIRYSVRLEGGPPEPAAAPDSILAVSPVADRIAFSSRRDGAARVYVATRSGGDVRPLSSAGHVEQPSFSPDGTRLVHEERENSMVGIRTSRIVVSGADGSDPRVLVEGGTDPHWSPDGDTVLYKQWDESTEGWIIATVDRRGGAPRLLRAGVLPDWSPDGQWIAFMTEDGLDTHVWSMRFDGSDARCLTCDR